jgi:hypothetical protein
MRRFVDRRFGLAGSYNRHARWHVSDAACEGVRAEYSPHLIEELTPHFLPKPLFFR